jgi:hypothetical protein
MKLHGVTDINERLAILRADRAAKRTQRLGVISPTMQRARIALEQGPMRRKDYMDYVAADGATYQYRVLDALARRGMARVTYDEAVAP